MLIMRFIYTILQRKMLWLWSNLQCGNTVTKVFICSVAYFALIGMIIFLYNTSFILYSQSSKLNKLIHSNYRKLLIVQITWPDVPNVPLRYIQMRGTKGRSDVTEYQEWRISPKNSETKTYICVFQTSSCIDFHSTGEICHQK